MNQKSINLYLSKTQSFAWLLAAILSFSVSGKVLSAEEQCLLEAIRNAKEDETVKQLKSQCQPKTALQNKIISKELKTYLIKPGLISKRLIKEKQTEQDPFVITPHLRNYILPIFATDQINRKAYKEIPAFADNFENNEAKIQLSIKAPLNKSDILFDNDKLYFGFTLQSWWQVYSNEISKPFRETNYRPEFFYLAPLNWHPLAGNTGLGFGIEHQSNGRSQILSRSWNRLYANFLFEKDNYAISFQPWWRLPENDKQHPNDAKGDDNPDINEYMGYFELSGAYKWDNYEFNLITRQNFATHKGAIEFGFTFPLWGKLLGYASFFSGYGESLIDYNHKQTRLGVGIALNNLL